MESLFLLKLLLGLVFGECFLVMGSLIANQFSISDQLSTEECLLLSHSLSELNLLIQVLPFELRAESGIFVFLTLLHLKFKLSNHFSFTHNEIFLALLVRIIIYVSLGLQLVELVLVNLEVGLDGCGLSQSCIHVPAEESLNHLLFFSKLLGQESTESLQELILQVFIKEIKTLLLLFLGLFTVGISTSLEHLAEVVFTDGLSLLLLFLNHIYLVLDALFLNFLGLLVLSTSAEEGTALLHLLFLQVLILSHSSGKAFIVSPELFQEAILVDLTIKLFSEGMHLVSGFTFANNSFLFGLFLSHLISRLGDLTHEGIGKTVSSLEIRLRLSITSQEGSSLSFLLSLDLFMLNLLLVSLLFLLLNFKFILVLDLFVELFLLGEQLGFFLSTSGS